MSLAIEIYEKISLGIENGLYKKPPNSFFRVIRQIKLKTLKEYVLELYTPLFLYMDSQDYKQNQLLGLKEMSKVIPLFSKELFVDETEWKEFEDYNNELGRMVFYEVINIMRKDAENGEFDFQLAQNYLNTIVKGSRDTKLLLNKEILKDEIVFLKEEIESLSSVTKKEPITIDVSSLEMMSSNSINHHYWKDRESYKLTSLYLWLLENGKLEENLNFLENFQVFEIDPINRVRWKRSQRELVYVFYRIYKNDAFQNETIYQIICKMFLDKDGEPYSVHNLNTAYTQIRDDIKNPQYLSKKLSFIKDFFDDLDCL